MTRARSRSRSLSVVATGCASGIGRHVAGRLVSEGHRVLATDVDQAGLEAAAREWAGSGSGEARIRHLDVRDASAWPVVLDEAIQSWGRLDVLLNIAGILRPGWVDEVEPADVERHLDINVKGVILGTAAAAVRMKAQGRGHIVNIASLAALAPIPGLSVYTASKFAVRGFSIAAAQELRRFGVYVTVVCPDAVQTPMLDLQLGYEQAALSFSGTRALTVEEVGDAVLGALESRRLEIALPWHRAWLARLAGLAPRLTDVLEPVLRQKGMRAQRKERRRRGQE